MLISTTKQYTNTKKFKNAPAGSHLGRLYKIVDIGSQVGEWQGKATLARKNVFYFELHGEDGTGAPLINDDGKPLIITKYYSITLAPKSTFRKHLQTWLNIDFDNMPGGFETKDLLGKFAMVNVTTYQKDGETKSQIDGLTAVPAIYMKHGLPEGVNELFIFELDEFDSDKFNSLSESNKKNIMDSPEYRALTKNETQTKHKSAIAEEEPNDDIPFN